MQLVDKIWALCEAAVRELGLELVDIEHVSAPGGSVLRLYIDKEGGVTVSDCAGVSREVGHILDAEDVVPGRYFLEVSSPGIDRVLRKPEHFDRFRGHEVRVRTREPINGQRKFRGKISSLKGDTLCLETENGETQEIPLEMVDKANLRGEVDFGRGKEIRKNSRSSRKKR
jgi:ribosome maturation factor RimP